MMWSVTNPKQAALANHSGRRQTGVTVFVVMVVMLVITLAGTQLINRLVSDTRNSMWEQDTAVARQAAEAALRDAEQDILCRRWTVVDTVGQYATPLASAEVDPPRRPHCMLNATSGEQVAGTDPGPGTTACNRGFLVAPVLATQTSANRAAALNACKANLGGFTQAPSFAESTGIPVGTEPRYSVEVIPVSNGQLGQIVPYYRITAVGFGRNSQTKVTLEVLFRPI